MHVEFKNVTTGKYYYLCSHSADYFASVWVPHILSHISTIDVKQTVGELCDKIRPVLDRLMGDEYHKWEVTIFRLPASQAYSLTEPAEIIARYEVGDIRIIDGVRQPTLFHPK